MNGVNLSFAHAFYQWKFSIANHGKNAGERSDFRTNKLFDYDLFFSKIGKMECSVFMSKKTEELRLKRVDGARSLQNSAVMLIHRTVANLW